MALLKKVFCAVGVTAHMSDKVTLEISVGLTCVDVVESQSYQTIVGARCEC